MKTLVISAVNLTEGGPLKILRDAVSSSLLSMHGWRIIILVNSKLLIENSKVQVIEFPKIKTSWLRRILFEWYYCKNLSIKLDVDLWLSLHDITPRVHSRRQVVYCHNPSPFYKISIRDIILDPRFFLFTLFYNLLYSINIHKNYFVVVQQDWLRDKFANRFQCKSIIVARPSLKINDSINTSVKKQNGKYVFLYPALPRVFKNFEVVCQAVSLLTPDIASRIELRLTIDGTENRYSRSLLNRFKNTIGVRFIGRQTWNDMQQEYLNCDAVLFPSRLETWGLPISEGKAYNKALLVADLPYARETVDNYDEVSFIDPNDAHAWADKIKMFVNGCVVFEGNQSHQLAEPRAEDWNQLWSLISKDL